MVSATVTTLAGTAGSTGSTDGVGTAARFNLPNAVAMDAAGSVAFVVSAVCVILCFVGATTVVTIQVVTAPTFPHTPTHTGLRGYEITYMRSYSGAIPLCLQADEGNHVIRRISMASATVTTLAGTAGSTGSTNGVGPAARFNLPSGIAMDDAVTFLIIVSGTGGSGVGGRGYSCSV